MIPAIRREQPAYQIMPMQSAQRGDYFVPVGRIIPEEIFTLSRFVFRTYGCEHLFAGIRVISGVIYFRGKSHRCGCEVLYLFQMHRQVSGDSGKFRHILLTAPRMARYEIRDELLFQSLAAIYIVEYLPEVVEQAERWFAHHVEYMRSCMFRGYFQTS